VLEQASTRGVLRGPVDGVLPAWMLYTEYAVQKIAKTIQLTVEEKSQLLHFRDTLKRLLLEAWRQTKAKPVSIYKAVIDGTYRVGGRLYAPDGAWIHLRGNFTPYVPIHGISAKAYFPDILKLPRQRLEPLQLGWRASDEGEIGGRPVMYTTQPWQLFARTTTRYGELRVRITSANLTREGASVEVAITAKSWRQIWCKAEAIDLVTGHLRRRVWAPVLTMWLGDGETKRGEVLSGEYKLVISAREPWRLGLCKSTREALVATGRGV